MSEQVGKIFTRDQLRTALRAALDDQPAYMNGDPIISADDIDYIAGRMYDEAGIEADISPLLEAGK